MFAWEKPASITAHLAPSYFQGHTNPMELACSGLVLGDAFNFPRNGQLSESQTKRWKRLCIFRLIPPRRVRFSTPHPTPSFLLVRRLQSSRLPSEGAGAEIAKRERLEGGCGKGLQGFSDMPPLPLPSAENSLRAFVLQHTEVGKVLVTHFLDKVTEALRAYVACPGS